ncbi:MAG: L-threonylcarbamoyladenylate synthase [Elusimicrobiota bacterium]
MSKTDKKVSEIANRLRKGEVGILPTDTVYGIFAVPGNEKGMKRIYEMKRRSTDKPLALLIPGIEWVWKWVERKERIEKLCRKYWPGAVTLIMEARDKKTIGLRIPDYGPLIKVMKATGPLCATSANIAGEPAPSKLEDIPASVKRACDFIEDFGMTLSGKPSRVIDITEKKKKIIRK